MRAHRSFQPTVELMPLRLAPGAAQAGPHVPHGPAYRGTEHPADPEPEPADGSDKSRVYLWAELG